MVTRVYHELMVFLLSSNVVFSQEASPKPILYMKGTWDSK